ncbi:hypothetical protein QQX98_000096 [Neonectria punicea]|uniref:Uncharacterized protein n=1 Tax=Neonectria punicea TaxID=979145 RepID=A0ABR1HVW0_9HYPO
MNGQQDQHLSGPSHPASNPQITVDCDSLFGPQPDPTNNEALELRPPVSLAADPISEGYRNSEASSFVFEINIPSKTSSGSESSSVFDSSLGSSDNLVFATEDATPPWGTPTTGQEDIDASEAVVIVSSGEACNMNGEKPCDECIRFYTDLENSRGLVLVQDICPLPDDRALGVRASIKDFFQLSGRYLPFFNAIGPVTTIELVHPLQLVGNDVIHMVDAPKLTIEVEMGITDGKIGCLPIEKYLRDCVDAFRSALQNNDATLAMIALDSLAELFTFRRQGCRMYGIGLKAEICPHDMECALDNFLEAYVNWAPDLPLHDIAKDVFEILCLARFLDNRRPVLADEGQKCLESLTSYCDSPCLQGFDTISAPRYMHVQNYYSWKGSSRVHEEIRNQLLFIVRNAIEEREMRLMKRFDELKIPHSSSRKDVFILSACQERMRLYYRRNRNRYSSFFGAADRVSNNKTMADFMTRRTCFIGFMCTNGDPNRSPFSGHFKVIQREALNNDEDLIAKFERLRVAEEHMFEESRSIPDDALYTGVRVREKILFRAWNSLHSTGERTAAD